MKQTGKMIFINGKIFTSDRLHPYADCMAVEDGRIAWIGRENEMPEVYRQSVSQDEFTDLRGRRVIPGFVDAHMHPVMLADCRKQITGTAGSRSPSCRRRSIPSRNWYRL